MKVVEFNEEHTYEYAIHFNKTLNPHLFEENGMMKPLVRTHLLDIAEDFKKFLGIEHLDVEDITMSGSNAAFTYTPMSDIDLHLIVDIPEIDESELYKELFNAKKFEYNTTRLIKIKGYKVELYVQKTGEPHISAGVYSVLHDRWIHKPVKRRVSIDDTDVTTKVQSIMDQIDRLSEHENLEAANQVWDNIKEMRKTGLYKEGEMSPENLAFKVLRNNGYIEKLQKLRFKLRDKELSLETKNPQVDQ